MMQTETASDVVPEVSLVASARSGSDIACDQLVTRHRARAVRIARSFVRDRDLAEDIAQEAFVRTFLAIKKLRDPGAFTSYLTRTIVRLSIDHSRKSSSHEIVSDPDPPPAQPSMSAEESIYIRAILDQLSVKLRTIIVLRDISGMDYAAIARTLRIPIGTVRSRLAAARSAFKAAYLSTGEEA